MSRTGQGALVISLDFELHWGVRDQRPLDSREQKRLLAARNVVPEILAVFREHSVRATWATVGLLFARSREEAEEYRPKQLPQYKNAKLFPYRESLGKDESEDPFHFAPSLIRTVANEDGQEVGSHSFSHYYSLEAGQSDEDFKADVASAQRIAENSGYTLRSYVFPRNQVRRPHLPLLGEAGFEAFRETEPASAKAALIFSEQRRPWRRTRRLLDAYWDLDGAQTVNWPADENPLPVGASRYLRPFSEALRGLEGMRLKRIADAMRSAALENRIFHLWWHPEDFAAHPERNLDFLRRALSIFVGCKRDYGMVSLSMGEVKDFAKNATGAIAGVSL